MERERELDRLKSRILKKRHEKELELELELVFYFSILLFLYFDFSNFDKSSSFLFHSIFFVLVFHV